MRLNMGNCWDIRSLEIFDDLNKRKILENSTDRVTEVFGSTRSLNMIGSARSEDRLPNPELEEVKIFVQRAHSAALQVNWTVNAPCVGSPRIFLKIKHWRPLFALLMEIGVDRLTVATPLLLEILKAENWPFKIELSTILNTQYPSQVGWYHDRYPLIDKICAPIYRNRDLKWVRFMSAVCRDRGIELELIVNEFCTVGGVPCEGIFRQSCYAASGHSLNAKNILNYPMGICTSERRRHPISWIKAPFILPQWIGYYEEEGVSHFKVTGRTHPPPFIHRMAQLYMSRQMEGNLLDLWAHLETIGRKADWTKIQEKAASHTHIDVQTLATKFPLLTNNHCFTTECSECKVCTLVWQDLIDRKKASFKEFPNG